MSSRQFGLTLRNAALWGSATLLSCLALIESLPANQQQEVQKTPKVDVQLPEYKPVKALAGMLSAGGSDEMLTVLTHLGEGFYQYYPNVEFSLVGKDGAAGPYAVIAGTNQFATMTREFTAAELKAFEKKYGYKPTLLSTSMDVLSVIVNRNNPIESLTLPQLDSVFSKARKLGLAEDISHWGQLGLQGKWAMRPIVLHGRTTSTDTHGFFKNIVLQSGDFKDSVKQHASSNSVVSEVSRDEISIGYVGLAYATSESVRAVALAAAPGQKPIQVTWEDAIDSRYPLMRPHYLALNYKPGEDLDPLRREFIKFIFSKQGQERVAKAGHVPMNAKTASEQLKKVGLGSAP